MLETVQPGQARLSGRLGLDQAAELARQLDSLLAAGDLVLDLGGVEAADSAILAALLHATRRARTQGRTLSLSALPDGLASLAELYGITELLTETAGAPQ